MYIDPMAGGASEDLSDIIGSAFQLHLGDLLSMWRLHTAFLCLLDAKVLLEVLMSFIVHGLSTRSSRKDPQQILRPISRCTVSFHKELSLKTSLVWQMENSGGSNLLLHMRQAKTT